MFSMTGFLGLILNRRGPFAHRMTLAPRLRQQLVHRQKINAISRRIDRDGVFSGRRILRRVAFGLLGCFWGLGVFRGCSLLLAIAALMFRVLLVVKNLAARSAVALRGAAWGSK
jgi:hypothetical protein